MRTVIEEQNVSDTLTWNPPNTFACREAYDALKWWLARCPESGEIIDDLHWLYRQDGDHYNGVPSFIVLYVWDRGHRLHKIPSDPPHPCSLVTPAQDHLWIHTDPLPDFG